MNVVEGGTDAFCSECQVPGHYMTAHHASDPPRPYSWPF
jgi:hypothetical protein